MKWLIILVYEIAKQLQSLQHKLDEYVSNVISRWEPKNDEQKD